jgi:hypothetical protein
MTGVMFGTLCPTFMASTHALFTSSLLYAPGMEAYMLLFGHFLGPKNVGNMASADETKLTGTLYNGEKNRFAWETCVQIHTEQHSVLNGLKDYIYARTDDSSKVRHLLKGIKTTELDVCKKRVVASPTLRDDFASTVELYSTFIKQIKAEKPQLNISEVSFSCGKGGKKSPTLQLMTASLINISSMLSLLNRIIHFASSG